MWHLKQSEPGVECPEVGSDLGPIRNSPVASRPPSRLGRVTSTLATLSSDINQRSAAKPSNRWGAEAKYCQIAYKMS